MIMFENRKMQALSLLCLFFLSTTVWLWFDRSSIRQHSASIESSLRDSLSFHQQISDAVFALFHNKPETSLSLLKETGMASGSNWADLAQRYFLHLDQQRDSLVGELKREHLQQMGKCQEQLNQTNQKAENIESKWAALSGMHNRLSQLLEFKERENQALFQKNQTLQAERKMLADSLLMALESVGQLEFTNRSGLKVQYFGYLKAGQAHGYGIGFYESGGIYRGNWANNSRNGAGLYVWKNGDSYEGEFLEGKRNGAGSYLFQTGEKFVGNWSEDHRDGYGEFFSADGKLLLKGLWEKDKFAKNGEKSR